ncbi:anti-sigma factor [Burkholderia alba]|uniref:anti-sigma factor n=1 Tax=Burkholderia alba TaxID=2683677 RepID=UPI002B056001|nr:anti-sigma factor [Burkholderia alba]
MNTPARSDHELRCAEYALGVLEGDERRALEHALPHDPALRTMLADWQARLAPLADGVAPIEPPARVWTRIRRDLGLLPAPGAERMHAGWWDSLRLWRWFAVGASVAALALLALNLGWLHGPVQPGAVANAYMVARIARSDGIAHWTATVDLQRASLIVVPADRPKVAADRSTELWLIPPNAKPISLGVFAPDAPSALKLAPAIVAQMSPRAILAVSLEPAGGSPTGMPTGPVLATGAMHGT